MEPLDLLAPEPAGRFAGEPARNAYVELHNVIAAAASTADFGPADRVRISRQRGVDLAREFADERLALYEAVLDARLATGDLDAEDRRVLDHVARTLALSAGDLRPAHRRAFGTTALDAVADGVLSAEERLLLFKLQHVLGLDPRLADGAYSVLAREHLVRVVAKSLADGSLSPDDEAAIALVAKRLSLAVPDDLQAMLEGARERWRLRQGELPDVEAPVPLEAGEEGRYVTHARWSALHANRFARAVGEVALASGRTNGLRVPRGALTGQMRLGRLVLTDRRLLFRPEHGIPDQVPLDRVLQTLRFRDGTVVRTRNERHVYLDPGDDNEAFYAVLHRTLFGKGRP